MTIVVDGTAGITFPNSTTQTGAVSQPASPFSANGLVYATSTSALTTGNALVFNGTNLGIGASASTIGAKLKVKTATRTAKFFDLEAIGGENWVIDSTNTVSSTDVLGIYANGATGMYLTDVGNLGIGTSSPSSILHIIATGGSTSEPNTALIVDYESGGALTTGGGTAIEFRGNSSGGGTANYQQARIRSIAQPTNNAHGLAFDYRPNAGTALTEVMRIDTNGRVGIGTTSPGATFEVAGQIQISGGTARALYLIGAASTAPYITINEYGVRAWDIGAGYYSSSTFSIQSNQVNGVYLGGTATAWASASDERFKDIIEPINNALTKVNGLRSVIGKYKTDEEGVRRSFLIAQDIQTQFPEALESSDPDKLGVQYTDVIPLLVASIKELSALVTAQSATITSLTERITALERKIA
jgi:hypothetical protein